MVTCKGAAVNDIVGFITVADPENQAITFSIDNIENFYVEGNTGTIKVNQELTTAGDVTVNVNIVDDEPTNSFTHQITVTITESTCAPKLVKNQIFTIDENSPAGLIVADSLNLQTFNMSDGGSIDYSITGSTPNDGVGLFEIHPNTSQITVIFSDSLNYEELFPDPAVNDKFILEIEMKYGIVTGQGSITIVIKDINEHPSISPESFDIDENSLNGVAVGTIVRYINYS